MRARDIAAQHRTLLSALTTRPSVTKTEVVLGALVCGLSVALAIALSTLATIELTGLC